MPRWASSVAILVGAYVVVMVGAALWLPHEWDWAVWDWLSARHAPVFDANEIGIVDVPWDRTDIPADRLRVAAFLDGLALHRQKPVAVVLDIQFGPCQDPSCGGPMGPARSKLIAAIRAVTSGQVPVYALEQPSLHAGDEAIALEPHDSEIYGALSGAAHSRFTLLSGPSGLFYRVCYDVPVTDASGALEGMQPVWDMVERVSMRPGQLSGARCDENHVPVRLSADPAPAAAAAITRLDAHGGSPASAQFTNKYVVVGTVSSADKSPDTPLYGPELLAWALSNALQAGSGADAERAYDTEPQGTMLLVLVPAFSAIALGAFIAIFFLLKGTRLRAWRRTLPWMSAVAAMCIGLGVVAFFEGWLLASRHIQPQVTLLALGVVLAPGLGSLRAYQYLFDQSTSEDEALPETYDYDVFVSYAHEEGAWVFEHVYAPLRDARLTDGRKLSVFFDTDSIRYGTAWQDKIALAINGSRFVVPVYSETYFSKPYCKYEMRCAHLKWIKAGPESRCLFPVMRGDPAIPEAVADVQAGRLDDDPSVMAQIVAEVVERLSRQPASASGDPTDSAS